MSKKIAVFPGSFDPFTFGHLNLVLRSLQLASKVHVMVGVNHQKKTLLSPETRLKSIQTLFKKRPDIQVDLWEGLTIDYCTSVSADFMVRGLRNVADFENEKTLAEINGRLAPQVETVFLSTEPQWGWLSSSVVKELLRFSKSINECVPAEILQVMREEKIPC